ncbi:MAG: flagellar type III secretion system pore protein FliP [Gemmatimonadetes bacterium]|nr:flagellar type III secretion system pore protein FliP [Gemmatimonadota bacterium]
MTGLAVATVVFAGMLGSVLVLLARARGSIADRRREGGLEVLERVSLGPKQGVAAVRAADRVILVSVGEGGGRPLAEIPASSWRRESTTGGAGTDDSADRLVASRSTPLRDRTTELVGSLRSASGGGADRRKLAARLARFWALIALCAAIAGPTKAIAMPASVTTVQEQELESDGFFEALPPLLEEEEEGGAATLRLDGPIGTALMIGALALLPTLLLLATGFTRILIVLHLLKQALGAQAVPPTHLVNALALVLTLFLMAPTLDRASHEAIDPWLDGEITQVEMFERVGLPFKEFMLDYADEDDVARFVDLRGEAIPESIEDVKITTLMAAFTTSELRRAFQLGFVLFLPFIVIDLVVASVLMSMGMFMLPPVMISLPFKLLLFVLADGWSLVVGGLLTSFR